MLLRQLGYLVALANERHFGRAAAACHVSQPALSGAIRTIEQELGVVIVQRGRRFEGFTPDGERVLAWARRILDDCESLRRDVRSHHHDPVGTLRMGVIPAALPLVPKLTRCCLRAFPRMRHEVHTLSASRTLDRLADFEIDLGLSYLDDERLHGAFEALPIFRERYVFVTADAAVLEGAAAMSWDRAAAFPLCLFTPNMQCRRGIDGAFAAAGHAVVPRVETDSISALYAHVRHAGLCSILPHSALCMADASERLSALPMSPELHRDIGLVLLDRRPRSTLLRNALDALRGLDLQGWVDGMTGIDGARPPR